MTSILSRAFTLIELLIVMMIIAILAAIAVPNFLEAQVRAKTSRARADIRTVITALETYKVDAGAYPIPTDLNAPNPHGSGFHSRTGSWLTTPVTYLNQLPRDVFLSQSAFEDPPYQETGVGFRYAYYHSPDHVKFVGSDIWDKLGDWIGEWAVYSVGPDGWPKHIPGNVTLLPYDSTNGSTSGGNIVSCQKNAETTPIHPKTGTYNWP